MHCTDSSHLIHALQNPDCYDHAVSGINVVETHISWVILTGSYAYKIKKPVNLGFLDFSTLALRKKYCEEELRLNRRLAPDFYLAVVPISGTPIQPQLGGSDSIFEYAVKMRQFPTDMELDRIAKSGQLTVHHIEQLAVDIAAFHANINVTNHNEPYGDPEAVWQPIKENFEVLQSCSVDAATQQRLQVLWNWCVANHAQYLSTLLARKQAGFIRECHGDMHLANMFLWQDRVVVFDCIEFNPALRWNDVISEIAFLTMDLRERGHPELARVFINRYLQETGDYAGLKLLNYYQVYRAMVRAKVACIRVQQHDTNDPENAMYLDEVQDYLQLAEQFTAVTHPVLFITHGVSGSGKTYMTNTIIQELNAVRVRSDVERKRLSGLSAMSSRADQDSGIYTASWTRQTYTELARLARDIIESGRHAIVDATFLLREQREAFHNLAITLNVPIVILAFTAPTELLTQRVTQRLAQCQDASDADLGVLAMQQQRLEPLTDAELQHTIRIQSDSANAQQALLTAIRAFLDSN